MRQLGSYLLIVAIAFGLIDTTQANTERPDRVSGIKSHRVAPANPDVLQSQDLSTGLTIEDIIAALVGSSSIAISNVNFTGSDSALGTFTGGTGIIGFEQGIVLSTGLVENVIGPNGGDGTGWGHSLPGDADLDSLIPGFETEDACILEFDFECPAVREIGFEYVFSSEEYNEFVYNSFNDVFGFFVNGENIALLPDGQTVVSIDNVNGGNPLGDSASNPQYYRNNDECQFSTVPSCPVNTEMDGLTVVLIARAKIQPGINHIKLAIADAGDDIYDSDVFLKGQSFVCGAVNNNPPICAINPSGTFSVNVGTNVVFTVTGTDPDDGQTIYLYPLGNLPPGSVMNPSLPRAGSRTGLSSQFSWTPSQAGVYAAAFFVTDSLGGADTAEVQITVTSPEVNNPPVCHIDPPGPFTINAGINVTFTVSATDPDANQVIRLTNLGTLPVGSTMNPQVPLFGPWTGVTSQFSWTPSQPGSFLARFAASDSAGGFDSISARINVLEGVAPFVMDVSPANGTFDVPWNTAAIIEFSETVVDNCNMATSPIPCVTVASARLGTTDFDLIWNGAILVVRPDQQWSDDDTITVTVSGELRDGAGNRLDGDRDGLQEGTPSDDVSFSFVTSPGVYSGDANDDGFVDERDVLPIGAHHGRTGPPRNRNTDIWSNELARPWTPLAATHADCDGNGVIDSTDICAVLQFFDQVVPAKRGGQGFSVGQLAALDSDIRQALASALLECESGTPAARAALLNALVTESDASSTLPRAFVLKQNYPNPFNAGTVIEWKITTSSRVELAVFDILGRRIRLLESAEFAAGSHTSLWDGRNESGDDVASGVYFYRIRANDLSTARSMVLVR